MYKNISDYGIIGDMHSAALVSNDGSIDYCSMPHIDSPTVFAALLDDEKGGFFKIQPRKEFKSKQKYIDDTNILSCIFATETGQAELFDFMSVSTEELFDKEEHSIHRCLKVTDGSVDFILECFPRPQYALKISDIKREDNVFRIKIRNEIFTLLTKVENYKVIENEKSIVIIQFSLKEGEWAHFDFIYGDKKLNEAEICNFEKVRQFWAAWLHNCIAGKCTFLGEYQNMVNRSLFFGRTCDVNKRKSFR